jgi:hypothetical protein
MPRGRSGHRYWTLHQGRPVYVVIEAGRKILTSPARYLTGKRKLHPLDGDALNGRRENLGHLPGRELALGMLDAAPMAEAS